MSPLEMFAYVTALVIFFLTLDDLFIDFVAFAFKLKPRHLNDFDLHKIQSLKEKKIAIMIANWKEDGVLQHMINGNLRRIDYKNVDFFLGVYPNDTATWAEASGLANKHKNVFVVVNSMQGPTTKGQMLNEIFVNILKSEVESGIEYDLFMLHDSEDILHPLSLKLINYEAEKNDFIQIPVLSLPVSNFQWVAGTYIDEFSEAHGKELCVREFLKGGVPSAGVGTAINRSVAFNMAAEQNELLRSSTLTEDYYLGISTHLRGFKSTFANAYRTLPNGQKDFIATREYFPQTSMTSIRQKTRWTTGISFQGSNLLGWQGDFFTRYFLWRDRRSFLNSVTICASMALILVATFCEFVWGDTFAFTGSSVFITLTLANTLSMIFRVIQRMRYVAFFYGRKTALFVPIRWLIANYINTLASFRAFHIHWKSRFTKTQPRWVKTAHVLPADFGKESEVEIL